MTHRERLAKSIERLQHEREVFISRIDSLTQEQLDYRPSRNAWSLGQVAHHVGLSERVWLSYIHGVFRNGDPEKGAIRKVSLQEIPFSSRIIPDFILKSPFVLAPLSVAINLIPRPLQSMFFAVPIFKMNAGPGMQPKQGMSRSQILKFLDTSRKATLKTLAPCGDWDLTLFRIIHPLVGDQDIYGILELLASHEQRHTQQIDSFTRAPSFPQPEGHTESL